MTMKDDLSRAAGWIPENKAKGLCVKCSRSAHTHCHTAAGHREVDITGLCEECFDEMFKEKDDDIDSY